MSDDSKSGAERSLDRQQEVIDFLADGNRHAAADRSAQRITTHASHLFLLADRVFKLKRAVRYSYLDYSSLAARERACRAEFELNRRTAPALYRAVRAITRRNDGGLEFDGAGSVVDWVVEMVRFDQGLLFDCLAREGGLTATMMRSLADEIAAFHAKAEIAPSFGGAAEIADVITDNAQHLEAACPPLTRHAVTGLRSASEAALTHVAALLESRRRLGKVRRCHGDLHLRNICLFEDRPTLFDCVDFSDRIACIDVLFDLAFLLMDLEHRDLRRLGNILFNRYLDRADESGGIRALPLFLSVRAAVRAKVAIDAGRQEAQATEARAYLDLAESLLSGSPPRLIAVGGLSGTGKSTLAAALAPDFLPAPGARVIRTDVLRKRLFGVAPEARLPQDAYDRAATIKVYDALFAEAATILASGYTAIADAVFLAPGERAAIEAVAARMGIPFTGLWLTAPPEILANRLDRRRGDASDADRAIMEMQLTIDPGQIGWRQIDAAQDAVTAARAALAQRQ
jgi:aminoglycoside phosphotransferase family enzyme/predicted kinase